MQQQLESERRRLAELHCEEAALNGMAAYQQEAMQVLEFANFADQMGGEVTFLGAAAAAADLSAAGGSGAAATDSAAADTAAAAEKASDIKDWVALYAATLVPAEQVDCSVTGLAPSHAAGAAQQAQQQAQQQAAAEGVATDDDRFVSSRSGSGGGGGSAMPQLQEQAQRLQPLQRDRPCRPARQRAARLLPHVAGRHAQHSMAQQGAAGLARLQLPGQQATAGQHAVERVGRAAAGGRRAVGSRRPWEPRSSLSE